MQCDAEAEMRKAIKLQDFCRGQMYKKGGKLSNDPRGGWISDAGSGCSSIVERVETELSRGKCDRARRFIAVARARVAAANRYHHLFTSRGEY